MKKKIISTAIMLFFVGGATFIGMHTNERQIIPSPIDIPQQEQSVEGIETNSEEEVAVGTSVEEINRGRPATVLKVIDGDTIEVSLRGTEQKIRIIGINTPESVDPRRPVECFGKEAAAAAKKKLTGQIVQLESDPTQDERDKYGRLLRFVWADNGETDFGAWMIKNGYAYEYTYQTPHKYQTLYRQLQETAEAQEQGLWSATTCAGQTAFQKKQTTQQATKKKHCSDFATQEEAQAYFNTAGGASSSEVKGMDGNGDGKVCTSLP